MIRLKFTSIGTRAIELDDGSMVYMERGDMYEFEEELAQKLMLDGTFSVAEDGEWESRILPEDTGEYEDQEGDELHLLTDIEPNDNPTHILNGPAADEEHQD